MVYSRFDVDFRLDTSFTLPGFWHLPNRKDSPEYGVLVYDPDKPTLSLELPPSRDPETEQHRTPALFGDNDVVHGLCNYDVNVTLWQVHANAWGTDGHTFSVNTAILGDSLLDDPKQEFEMVSFTTHGLSAFRAFNYFEHSNKHPMNYNLKEDLELKLLRIPCIDSSLWFGHTSQSSGGGTRIEITVTDNISLQPNIARPLDWLLERATSIAHLLTLLTGERDRLNTIQTRLPNRYNFLSVIKVLHTERRYEDPSRLVAFKYEHLPNIAEVLECWCSLDHFWTTSIRLSIDAMRIQDHSIEGRFLTAAQSVEVLSCGTHGKTIPGMKGKEPTLKERLRHLAAQLPDCLQRLTCKNPGEFAEGVAATRNYYTHYRPGLRRRTLDFNEMFVATEKMIQVVRIYALRQLGLDDGLIAARLNEHWRIRQLPSMMLHVAECRGSVVDDSRNDGESA